MCHPKATISTGAWALKALSTIAPLPLLLAWLLNKSGSVQRLIFRQQRQKGSQKLLGLLLALVLAEHQVSAAEPGLAGVANENRARINYMLNCQGCHGPDAQGSEAANVPRMKDFVGSFLKVSGGREFLVQVPGSANASVTDAELAELLNWMIPSVSANEMPARFKPYTTEEITTLRYSPEEDVLGKRKELIQAIDAL